MLLLKSTIKLNYMAVKYLKEHTGIYLIRFSSSVLNLHTLQFIFKWFLGDNMFVVFPFYFSSFFFLSCFLMGLFPYFLLIFIFLNFSFWMRNLVVFSAFFKFKNTNACMYNFYKQIDQEDEDFQRFAHNLINKNYEMWMSVYLHYKKNK